MSKERRLPNPEDKMPKEAVPTFDKEVDLIMTEAENLGAHLTRSVVEDWVREMRKTKYVN